MLERWANMADAETSVVTDAHLAGNRCASSVSSQRPLPRIPVSAVGRPGYPPRAPVPQFVRKTARAINAASGNRPLVVLNNLSGFDGSPGIDALQLE